MNILGLTIEILVSILLIVTILYCWVLNKRLRSMRADELALQGTIAELISTTEIAERAIADMKRTAALYDESLGRNIAEAKALEEGLNHATKQGQQVIEHIAQVVLASSAKSSQGASSKPKPQATAKVEEAPAKQPTLLQRAEAAARKARTEAEGLTALDKDLFDERAA